MLNMKGKEKLKEIESKLKLDTFYDAETKKDISFLIDCYNSLTWDIESLKEKLNEYKPYQFIDTICDVCKDYGFSISHEDSQGSFIIEKYDDGNINWFKNARVDMK